MVQSDKCGYAGDLFQDDDPTVNLAFPENPPLDDKDLIDESEIDSLVNIQDAKGEEMVPQPQPSSVQSSSQGTVVHKSNEVESLKNKRIYSQTKPLNLTRGQIINHKYSLRSRA